MDAFQTNIIITVEIMLLPLIIGAISIGLSGFRLPAETRSPTHLLVLAIGLILFLLAAHILSTASYFDFVDRCGPNGTALCFDGRTPNAVRLELWKDLAFAIMIYLAAPILASLLGLKTLKKFSPANNTPPN
jgi:hypothetical protein